MSRPASRAADTSPEKNLATQATSASDVSNPSSAAIAGAIATRNGSGRAVRHDLDPMAEDFAGLGVWLIFLRPRIGLQRSFQGVVPRAQELVERQLPAARACGRSGKAFVYDMPQSKT